MYITPGAFGQRQVAVLPADDDKLAALAEAGRFLAGGRKSEAPPGTERIDDDGARVSFKKALNASSGTIGLSGAGQT